MTSKSANDYIANDLLDVIATLKVIRSKSRTVQNGDALTYFLELTMLEAYELSRRNQLLDVRPS